MTEGSPENPRIAIDQLRQEIKDLSEKVTALEGHVNTQKAELDGNIKEIKAGLANLRWTVGILIAAGSVVIGLLSRAGIL